MINNKKLLKQLTLTCLFLISTSFYISCEENDVETTKTNSAAFQEKDDDDGGPGGPGGSVTIGMRVHRGEKWSKKNGVKPCTKGFGVCSVRVESVSGEYKNVKVIVKFTPTPVTTNRTAYTYNATARIVFLEKIEAQNDDIFISSEDDDFSFPSDVISPLKLSELTIIADDYITHFDSEYPYGYVDVNCIAK